MNPSQATKSSKRRRGGGRKEEGKISIHVLLTVESNKKTITYNLNIPQNNKHWPKQIHILNANTSSFSQLKDCNSIDDSESTKLQKPIKQQINNQLAIDYQKKNNQLGIITKNYWFSPIQILIYRNYTNITILFYLKKKTHLAKKTIKNNFGTT